MALPRRFRSTCLNLVASARTANPVSAFADNACDFLSASGTMALSTSLNAPCTERFSTANSMRPASILERSKMSLIKVRRCFPPV